MPKNGVVIISSKEILKTKEEEKMNEPNKYFLKNDMQYKKGHFVNQ